MDGALAPKLTTDEVLVIRLLRAVAFGPEPQEARRELDRVVAGWMRRHKRECEVG